MNGPLSPYEKISFEEAARILYYHFSDRPELFKEFMEQLFATADQPYWAVTPKQHAEFREELNENKKSK
jgi:AcrR family transcriptional regulator